MIKLRKIDLAERRLSGLAAYWKNQGHQASLEQPVGNGLWVKVRDADDAWQGWLNLHDWIKQAAPQLAGVALSAGLESQVLQWLAACERPVNCTITGLNYRRLCFGEAVTRPFASDQRLLRVISDDLPLWLEQVCDRQIHSNSLPALRWPLRFTLGDSRIAFSSLSRVNCFDVLLIQKPIQEIRCYTKTLGIYQRSEQGISMELQQSPEYAETSSTDDNPRQTGSLHDLSQLPVQLEFVLHRSQMTLAQLQSLSAEEIFPLPASVESTIEIYVNGVLLGNGELVQLDNQPGVEIHHWFGKEDHAR